MCRSSITVKLSLMDDEGIFYEAAPFHKPANEPSPGDGVMRRLADAEQRNEELAVDLAAAQESLDQERAETSRLKEELRLLSASSEVSKLKDELKEERKREAHVGYELRPGDRARIVVRRERG